MEIPILYEDNHLLIVEKPVNIPVQQDRSNDPDLLNLLKRDLKIRYNKPGNVYLSLIHRLDRPVGGAIVFAKTSKAASRLANLLRQRKIKRKYLAVVHGSIPNKHKTLVHYLRKDRKKNEVSVVPQQMKHAKKAILHYRVLEQKKEFSLVEIELETGRSHQIRVQFQAIGHPLFGDQKYGERVNKPGQQIALWANELSFVHPVRKTEVTIQSNPPNRHPWNIWVNTLNLNTHKK